MRKLRYAWIEQMIAFDSDSERAEYIEKQKALAELKKQAPIHVVSMGYDGSYFTLHIRKPYNSNPMVRSEPK